MQNVSLFKDARSPKPAAEVPLTIFLRSEKHRDTVEKIRLMQDKKQRDEAKKNLPAATISGTFMHRSAAEIKEYNGIVCLDFDAKENPNTPAQRMKDILSSIAEVSYAGLSVSGTGVFALIPTDNTDPALHSSVTELIGRLMERAGLIYDRACKDVCRLRFVSFDPDPVERVNPIIFPATRLLQAQKKEAQAPVTPIRPPRPFIMRQVPDDVEGRVEEYIQCIEGGARDLTNNYEDWVRIGMAFANQFGDQGLEYFKRISYFHPEYNAEKTEKKFNEFARKAQGRNTIGTFFLICHKNNIRP